jgi:hypothetical protein
VKPQSGGEGEGREASLKRHAMKEAKRNKENRDRVLEHQFNKRLESLKRESLESFVS